MTEIIYISLVIAAVNGWFGWSAEAGRPLAFIGHWMDRYYNPSTNTYASWIMPFACTICRTWWSSVGVAVWLASNGHWAALALPFFSHIMIRAITKYL